MDLHAETLLEQYDNTQEDYKLVKDFLIKTLQGFVDSFGFEVNSVGGRIKTRQSLIGKLELKGYKYKDIFAITDIVGVRIVTFYSDQVDKFAAKIEQKFTIDWDNSIDKRKQYSDNEFGYMSLHFICRIPESLYKVEGHPKVNQIPFEIQIRSVLQHTWATIFHDTGYKNDIEVPHEYLRKLNRLAGLLEIADESFKDIRNSIDNYRRQLKQIVKNGDFDKVELNGDSFDLYIKNGGFDSLNKKIASINNMEITPAPLKKLLFAFKFSNFKTLGDVEKYKKEKMDVAYRLNVYLYDNTDIDIISEFVGPLSLLVISVLEQGWGENGLIRLLDYVYGERKSNARYAANMYEAAKKIGVTK